jgi:hypothetical protein
MKDPNKNAHRWFRQSEDDYRFVKWLKSEGDFFDKGCFMAQQAGEKALKSCLYATGKRRVIGHSCMKSQMSYQNGITDSKKLIQMGFIINEKSAMHARNERPPALS